MRNHLPKLALCFQCVILMLSLSACGGGGGGGSSPAPSAITMGANPVTNENAVLLGDVNPNGQDTTAWFEYGSDSTFSVFSKTPDQPIGSGTVEVPVQATIQNLNAGAAYYFRVAASNPAGTRKGDIVAFNAALLPPAASTAPAQPVTNDNAVLNGVVNPRGLATTAWYEWGTDPTLNARTSTTPQSIGSGTADVPLPVAVTDLSPGTTYYFRIVGQNSVGISRGPIESVKAAQVPVGITNAATAVTSAESTLNASINPNGLQTNYWFLWGTDPALTAPATTHETPMQQIAAGTFTAQAVTAQLAGLSVSTTYYFRVVASNADGETQGAILSFTTTISPTVATQTPTAVTTTGAVLHGTVNPNAYATTAFFQFGTDPALNSSTSTAGQALGSGTTSLPVSVSLGPLATNTTYYYRVVATNSGGTGTGAIRSFFTGARYVAVGDSITLGSHDTIPGDGTGFEPILGDLLGALVANEGVSATTSADGASSIAATLATYPSAQTYLVLYGTNDASSPAVASGLGLNPGNPGYSGSYKEHMQQIVTAIMSAGKTPCLGKVPFASAAGFDDAAIQEYNAVVDELVAENGISVVPPDFYSWFQSHQSQLDDGLHPNGTGYQSMANLWFNALP